MSRYIDIEPLMTPDNIVEEREDTGIDELPYKIRYGLNIDVIRNAPTVDVVEVRHGEWAKSNPYNRFMNCSVCGFGQDHTAFNYCPNCGAYMRGANDGT